MLVGIGVGSREEMGMKVRRGVASSNTLGQCIYRHRETRAKRERERAGMDGEKRKRLGSIQKKKRIESESSLQL